MIVVTGTPRSGTSMIMQTLRLLGIDIVGEAFTKLNLPEHNPKGYWELENDLMRNGIHHQDYKGKGVKLLGHALDNTPPENISKLIYITRNKNYSIKSLVPCLEDNKPVVFSTTLVNINPTRNNAERVWNEAKYLVDAFLAENQRIPTISFDYKDWIKDTENQLKMLVEFLDVKCDYQKALDNIDTDKRW